MKTVYLMLGNACNWDCKYCIQKGSANTKKKINPKIYDYIRNLGDVRINFWGGEPLLYKSVIDEVIENLGERKYLMVTNGSLIDDKIVDWANYNKITMVLSHDGKQTKEVRDRDVLLSKDFVDTFNALHNRGVNSVIHAYNLDYHELWDYIEDKLGNIYIKTGFLDHTWDMPKALYKYDYKKYSESVKRVHNVLIQKIKEGNFITSREHGLFFGAIKRFSNNDIYPPACGAYKERLDIDLEGNIWTCHNGFFKYGNVETENIFEKYKNKYIEIRQKNVKPCPTCEVKELCREGCFLSISQYEHNTCKLRKILYNEIYSFLDDLGKL